MLHEPRNYLVIYKANRPDLTWRDIQYLCIETAGMINNEDPDWERTASGRKYSYKYGYGVLDAYRYVKAAQSWKLVKPQAWYATNTVRLSNGTYGTDRKYYGGEFIPSGGLESKISITKTMLESSNFETLEHINVKVWIDHTTRGEVEVEIVSPNGIRSVLGGARPGDRDGSGYPGWTFMSVKHWFVTYFFQPNHYLISLLCRGENPVGDWTIKVKDRQRPDSNGTFLGWNMILWGSSIDPSQAVKFEVPLDDDMLPPAEVPPRPIIVPSSVSTTATRQHPKPTFLLPGDHGVVTGENSKPAFTSTVFSGSATSPTSTPSSATISPTPDFAWFSDMSSLVTNQKWFFGALGAVSVFGIGVGIFFWRRRVARIHAANYTALNNDNEVSMTALGTSITGGPRTTRELYDAFGEVSDDDDDDETTALRQPLARSVGFHSGFLVDDEPSTAAGLTPKYRDDPDHDRHTGSQSQDDEAASRDPESPTESGGSWEHASRE